MPNVTVARSREISELAKEVWTAGDAPDFTAAIYKAAKLLDSMHDFADAWDLAAAAQADESESYEADEDGALVTCTTCNEVIAAVEAVGGCPACHAAEIEAERVRLEQLVYVPSSLDPRERRAADKALFMKAGGAQARRVGRFWFVASRTSSAVYRTTLSSCSCLAGERNVPCWHKSLVALEGELAA